MSSLAFCGVLFVTCKVLVHLMMNVCDQMIYTSTAFAVSNTIIILGLHEECNLKLSFR